MNQNLTIDDKNFLTKIVKKIIKRELLFGILQLSPYIIYYY